MSWKIRKEKVVVFEKGRKITFWAWKSLLKFPLSFVSEVQYGFLTGCQDDPKIYA